MRGFAFHGVAAMSSNRKALSKRTRFEVFKRDGFRCVYCGHTPVDGPMHVDHVVAVANGGANDPSNLVTACGSCNLGKSDVPLEQRRLAPASNADDALEQAEQIRAYLAAQREIEAAKRAVVDALLARWVELDLTEPSGLESHLGGAVAKYGIPLVTSAIEAVAAAADRGRVRRRGDLLPYMYGCLRNMKARGEGV